MIVIGKKNTNDMAARRALAVSEPSLDQIAAEVAVHAVVGSPRNVAVVTLRIDLHMDMSAPSVAAALSGGKQGEVAFDENADRLVGVSTELNGRVGNRPDDLQAGNIRRASPSRKEEKPEGGGFNSVHARLHLISAQISCILHVLKTSAIEIIGD